MKNDLTNEEKKDNKFSESHLKRIKIGSRILFIFAMILLIIMLLVGIVLLVEKDFNSVMFILGALLVIDMPLFLLAHLLKRKPEKVIHSRENLFLVDSKEYKIIRSATIQELNKIYGVDKPYMHFKVPLLYMQKYGGEVPLEQVIVYDCGDYFHFITIGMTAICAIRGEAKFEYTFKLKKKNTETFNSEIEMTNVTLNVIAAISSAGNELIKHYQIIPGEEGKGMDSKEKSKITGYITVPDININSITIQNDKIDFIEIIGVTDEELKSITTNQITVKELFEKIDTDITDYDRDSINI